MKHLVATFWLAVFSMLSIADSHAATVTYVPEVNVVVVDGTIEEGDAVKLIQEMQKVDTSKPSTVALQSYGGSLAEGLIMAEVVRTYGITTYVSTYCASACSVIFASGYKMLLTKEATIGVHNPYLPIRNEEGVIIDQEDSVVGGSIWWKVYGSFISSFNEEDLAKKWVDRTFKTPSEDMYWIDNLSAEDYGIVIIEEE